MPKELNFMDISEKLHRLSLNQLRVLELVAKSEHGVVSSSKLGRQIKISGKPLGGIFSSLARQKINGEKLLSPWGRAPDGVGLRWKLNAKVISQQKLLSIVKEILSL